MLRETGMRVGEVLALRVGDVLLETALVALMPANFPTAEQKRYYGRFVEGLTPEQLGGYFHLTDTDRHLVYSRTKEHTQLGLAVQFSTARWLFTRAWLHDEPSSRLFDLLVLRLKERKVILPGITTLEECINHIREQVAQCIWKRIERQLTGAQRERLQELMTKGPKGQTLPDELRHGPVTISPGALRAALERIKELRKIAVSELDLSWLAPDRLKKLARHAGPAKAYTIRRLAEPRKWATLAAFTFAYESRAVDDALDLSVALVQTRLTRAGQQGEKKRIRTLRDPDQGRYEIHELLRQYAAELLEAEPEAYTAARDAHNVDPAFGLRSE